MKILKLILVITVSFFLFNSYVFAQTATPSAATLLSLFSPSNCVRTCLIGIQPGITTLAEFKVILASRNITYFLNSWDGSEANASFEWKLPLTGLGFTQGTNNQTFINTTFANGIVRQMTVGFDIPIQSIISAYGQPPQYISQQNAYYMIYNQHKIIFQAVSTDSTEAVTGVILVDDNALIAYTNNTWRTPVVSCTQQTGVCSVRTATPTPTFTPSPTPTPSTTPPQSGSCGGSNPTARVTNSTDDVNEVDGVLSSSSATVWVGTGGSSTNSWSGLRFNPLPIPKNSTIHSAKLCFYSSQSQWIVVNVDITAEASDNAATFSSTSRPSQRTPLSTTINHATDLNWSANTWYEFQDITLLVQTVVNRPGWQSGNALALMLKGKHGTFSRKFANSWDNSSINAPQLVVTYTPPNTTPLNATFAVNGGNDDVNELNGVLTSSEASVWVGTGGSSTNSWSGLRFTSVSLPRGAVIVAARLEVYSNSNQWIQLGMDVWGHAADNSTAFSSTARPSDRALTSARVQHASNENWNTVGWKTLQDVTPIIQEILNRPSWQSGNALSLLMKGTFGTYSRKFITSYEGGASFAARLVVQYRL